MKPPSPIILAALLQGIQAQAPGQNTCSFRLRTEGANAAPVSQFNTGQAQANPNAQQSTFTIAGNALADAQGRTCWWTPPAQVLQCDAGQAREEGFSIGCDGMLSFNGQTRFLSCRTGGAGDPAMIYREPNGSECGEVTLHADGCLPSTCGGGYGTGAPNTLPLPTATNFPGPIGVPPGGGTGAPPGYPATSTLPLQGLTNFPFLGPIPVATATSTLPLQGLTSFPLFGSVPGVGTASAPQNTGTLPLQGLTNFPGIVGPAPTYGGGGGATTMATRRSLPGIAPPPH